MSCLVISLTEVSSRLKPSISVVCELNTTYEYLYVKDGEFLTQEGFSFLVKRNKEDI